MVKPLLWRSPKPFFLDDALVWFWAASCERTPQVRRRAWAKTWLVRVAGCRTCSSLLRKILSIFRAARKIGSILSLGGAVKSLALLRCPPGRKTCRHGQGNVPFFDALTILHSLKFHCMRQSRLVSQETICILCTFANLIQNGRKSNASKEIRRAE